ncbi:hypothetical protein HLB25_13305 [Dickeya dadantii]|uniref:StbB family protein n=1 Tax=Dickeya dadantii TaxID=204038 RepID=UPI001495FF0E|nr:StbB family protein [Dickeya dadantii]NPE55880.1 hypothetical protein [Dickeya dadantii]NPE67652.1 hypothetical protein [Dickeya dadantii]
MKVAIMNFSGNNGKTTLSENLFLPRIPLAKYLAVESINAGSDAEKVKGKDFGYVQEEVMLADSAIVDVGASNVEDFFKLMRQYSGSHEEFDRFIIPAVASQKQMEDTLSTIKALSALKVHPKKIRVVFNMVDVDDDVESDFYPLYAMNSAEKNFTLNNKAVIYKSELYQLLRIYSATIPQLIDDATDWRQKLKESKTEEERQDAVKRISMRRLAISAQENLDAVWSILKKD